jgi:hypothetical protein
MTRPYGGASTWVVVVVLAGLLGVAPLGTLQAQSLTTLQGRLERKTSTGTRYGAAYVQVNLRDAATGRRVSVAYTGRDGVYTFSRLPAGTYVLEIVLPGRAAPRKYRVKALAQAYTRIGPILIP